MYRNGSYCEIFSGNLLKIKRNLFFFFSFYHQHFYLFLGFVQIFKSRHNIIFHSSDFQCLIVRIRFHAKQPCYSELSKIASLWKKEKGKYLIFYALHLFGSVEENWVSPVNIFLEGRSYLLWRRNSFFLRIYLYKARHDLVSYSPDLCDKTRCKKLKSKNHDANITQYLISLKYRKDQAAQTNLRSLSYANL